MLKSVEVLRIPIESSAECPTPKHHVTRNTQSKHLQLRRRNADMLNIAVHGMSNVATRPLHPSARRFSRPCPSPP
eukprot:7525275-Alexandrium_andersonii.AAC.1